MKMSKRTKNKKNKNEKNNSNVFEGIGETDLYHGLKLASSTPLMDNYEDICYSNETREYLALETGSMVHRFSMQGKPIRPSYPLGSTMLFTRMAWCSLAKVFASFIPHDDMIWIMTAVCKLVQIVRNEFRIEELFYSPVTNQMVIVGTNKITTFLMEDVEHPLNSLYTINYLDTSYGALWTIENSSLIEDSSGMMVVGSYLTNIYLMSLQLERETEGGFTPFQDKRLNATKAAITALCYHRTSKWIITGDQLGNVSGWDLKLECLMSCLNAHNSEIQLIVRHPSICGFLTVCNDNVLQVWSCNLRERIEAFRDIGKIWRVAVNETAASLASLGTKLNCFHMHQLYVFYAPLTAPATNLFSTHNPTIPTRVIVSSSDNTVSILSSRGARQINVQLLSPKLKVVDVSFSEITQKMYTIILRTGETLVSSNKKKPMKLKNVWVSDERTLTCIVAYESFDYIQPIEGEKTVRIVPVSTLIIAGTLDGKLVTIEQATGKHISIVSAHNGSIIDMSSSLASRQIVSVGEDKCVKVWRVFADIESPLVLMHSVYYVIPITRVSFLRFTVCMASSTKSTAKHRIIMYNTTERIRLDHHPSKEHSALVTSLATLESLEICASSAMDNTIRIWNQQNELLKIMQINTIPRHIIFSSQRGEIVFSAGKHLYRIPYENYLSPEYRARITHEKIPEEAEDVVVSENVDYKIYEDEVDRDRALHPVSSTPFGSLDIQSTDALRLERMLREQTELTAQYRNEDISRIQEGTIRGTRLVGDKSMMSYDTWNKHLSDLLGTSAETEEEESQLEKILNLLEKYPVVEKTYSEPEVFRMLHGYSMPSLSEFTEGLRSTVKDPKLPRGFIPNSLIYNIYEEPIKVESSETLIEKRTFKYRYPSKVLYGDALDETEDFRIHITPSQLAGLEDSGEDSGEDEMNDE